MKQKIFSLSLVVFMIGAMVLSGCAPQAAAAKPAADQPAASAPVATGFDFEKSDKVVFGVLTYLTGKNMEQGLRSKAIVDLAVEQLNAAGGVLGKKVEVQYFDSGNDQQTVLNSVQKIVATEGMSGFFGCMYSGDTIAYLPTITKAKMVSLTAGNSENVLKQNNPYIWMPRISDARFSQIMANLAIETLGMKKPAIIFANNASGQSFRDKVVETLKAAKMTPVFELSYDPATTTNYAPFVSALINSGADGLLLSANSSDSSGVLSTTALKQGGFTGPVVAFPALMRLDTIAAAGGAMEGYYGVAEFDVESKDPLISKVVAEFRAKYPNMQPTWIEAVFYDSLMLLVEAAKIANSTNPEKINEGMSKIKEFKGMMGTHSFHADHATADGIYTAKVENGQIIFGDYLKRAQ